MESGKFKKYFMIHPLTFSGPLHKQSYHFALHAILFSKSLMKEKEYVLSKQFLRSATSVGANIEEAQQPQSRADFISKLSIALKEATESRYWLHLIHDSGFACSDVVQPLIEQSNQIIGMLVTSIKTSKSNPH